MPRNCLPHSYVKAINNNNNNNNNNTMPRNCLQQPGPPPCTHESFWRDATRQQQMGLIPSSTASARKRRRRRAFSVRNLQIGLLETKESAYGSLARAVFEYAFAASGLHSKKDTGKIESVRKRPASCVFASTAKAQVSVIYATRTPIALFGGKKKGRVRLTRLYGVISNKAHVGCDA